VATIHCETVTDNWYYLRDRQHPETLPYLEAENKYTAQATEPAADLETKIYTEMVGRIQETDSSVPAKYGDFEYYTRMEQGKQYPIHCRHALTTQDTEQIVLDCNTLAAGHG